MPNFKLNDPIELPGAIVISRIEVSQPRPFVHREMQAARPFDGFSPTQVRFFAARLSHFGELTLRMLSDADYAQLALAVEKSFKLGRRRARGKRGSGGAGVSQK